jgi:uridine kinase
VLIAGPSSSGKTTSSYRLAVQLMVNGLKPVTIALDDYFVNRDRTPLDEEGKPDFESIDAVDVDLFNQHLGMLINGEEVRIDVMKVNDMYSVNVANFGFEAEVCDVANKVRRKKIIGGRRSYTTGIIMEKF